MTKEFFALSFGFVILIAATNISQAQSQVACTDHAAMVEKLSNTYGETRQSIGLVANNSVLEVFASQETGTWTITVTQPGGPTCMVASGFAYETMADTVAKPGRGI